MRLRVGGAIDRYVIEDVLGEGGMGTVYRARDPKLHRSVALKVLSVASEDGRAAEREVDARARLIREARAAAALEHPNVVAVYDVGETDGAPFIAMELVDGRSLRSFVGDASVTLEQKIRWLVDVARALDAAHERGLVHRDVKPENVMIRRDGVLKVLDFGIARKARSADTAPELATITAEGIVIGTPLYMAPEQLRGEPLDGRADQFSWGAMAYELLTGTHPWGKTGDAMAIAAAIASKDVESPKGVPDAEAQIVLRALSKRPGDRHATMAEVARALEAVAPARRTDAALAPTQMAPTVPPVRPPGRARIIVLGAVVGALTAGAFGFVRLHSAPAHPASAGPGASAASAPTACGDLPVPESRSLEASTAYRAGLQASCDANWDEMTDSFRRAVAADPGMAAAHLRLASVLIGPGNVAAAREEFQAAMGLRATLSDRDRALLAIHEPRITRTPPDLHESLLQADAAIERWPLDAEFWKIRGATRVFVGDVEHARADLRRAAELDPHYAVPFYYLGQTYLDEGRDDEALAAFDKCVEIAHNAVQCLDERIDIESRRGDCARMAADSESEIAVAPKHFYAYWARANGLAWNAAAPETLAAAVRQSWENWPGADRARADMWRAQRTYQLSAWTGDFAAAEAAARSWQDLLANDSSANRHAQAAWAIARVYEEEGRLRDAGAVADDFLKRRALWTVAMQHNEVGSDPTPRLLEIAHRAGSLSTAEWEKKRDAWIAQWTAIDPSPIAAGTARVGAYLVPAETPDEAREALARTAGSPSRSSDWSQTVHIIFGKAYFLAGRVDEAMDHLRRAARPCMGLDEAIDTTRAAQMLGQALESRGDKDAACAAYRTVTDRWGRARPRSVTAEKARASAAKFGCAR